MPLYVNSIWAFFYSQEHVAEQKLNFYAIRKELKVFVYFLYPYLVQKDAFYSGMNLRSDYSESLLPLSSH